jgi:hypothetical protein
LRDNGKLELTVANNKKAPLNGFQQDKKSVELGLYATALLLLPF